MTIPSTDTTAHGEASFVCHVTTARVSAYPDPLILAASEQVTLGENDTTWPRFVWCTTRQGKSGWVPAAYLDRQGTMGILLREYDATELSVDVGEELTILDKEGGWFWCANHDGQRGWVPAKNVVVP